LKLNLAQKFDHGSSQAQQQEQQLGNKATPEERKKERKKRRSRYAEAINLKQGEEEEPDGAQRRRELGLGRLTAYRERVDLVGAALLEGVVVLRSPRHGSFPPGGSSLCSAPLRGQQGERGGPGQGHSGARWAAQEEEEAAARLDLCSLRTCTDSPQRVEIADGLEAAVPDYRRSVHGV